MRKAIIGGTGVYDIGDGSYSKTIETSYGKAEVNIVRVQGEEIVFLARHGVNHSVPPHLINYMANMMALKELGVKYVYATAAVGSCNENYAPGDIVVIKDFIDFTKQRPLTFFEGGNEPVKHVDMSDPYCKNLRQRFYEAARTESIHIKGDAVYVCTEGPRFETASEIKMYKRFGGDVVGMTSVPEVVLAKELGICYATVGIVTNWCTGMEETMTIDNMHELLSQNKEKITKVFLKVFIEGLNQDNCNCSNAIVKL
ncbi:S-methyl-5'-thioinosine phosphorylase [Tepidimicrobium xylanilyticum]|uniref:Purine nucleoside phosphorylase n=1 Tax=Tepidimicrobium xylanilyticum TaxID=1123352 RepID=A0A1H2R9P6_9FIRM|nr:S-methyl-5'-thioinosine phosphorylase [Tepidimicrobium xylanilyticum]NLW39560.1 S-methyl-5'-thioinosine phosphorylase [Tissierellia bacterium]GMG95493.1 methylthioadenosine phosphorylase [Tepidimicrobium xylanilyticum]SDW15409.1 5'-methylthioadenosine phosphorylase [Tepidimicrobium xylanilyticum]